MKVDIKSKLEKLSQNSKYRPEIYFKTGVGEYAHHDKFRGIKTPVLRKLAAEFRDVSYAELKGVIASEYNEDRALALYILAMRTKADLNNAVQFYLDNLEQINNWNLVDISCPIILGPYIVTDESLLYKLAKSKNIWERRIAIVTTLYFIKKNELELTLEISQMLLDDSHDLIHKAVGWMLREVGKKDVKVLKEFLNANATSMPRVMLRYAIERFSKEERDEYLKTIPKKK